MIITYYEYIDSLAPCYGIYVLCNDGIKSLNVFVKKFVLNRSL